MKKMRIIKYGFYGLGIIYALIQFMDWGFYNKGDNMDMLIISFILIKIGIDIEV